MQTIQQFADKYHVKVRRDSCGDIIIAGFQTAKDMPKQSEYRNHIFDGFNDGRFGVSLMFLSRRRWTLVKRRLLSAGFTIKQDGDTEGTALFDPTNDRQAQFAMTICQINKRRMTWKGYQEQPSTPLVADLQTDLTLSGF
jgi:hypothetical protein